MATKVKMENIKKRRSSSVSPTKAKRIKLEDSCSMSTSSTAEADVPCKPVKVTKSEKVTAAKSTRPKSVKKKTESAGSSNQEIFNCQGGWKVYELLADVEQISPRIAQNIVNLFDDDNTIPFIARYRQDATDGMTAEKLRHVRESYDFVRNVRTKAETLLKSVAKECPSDKELAERIVNARSLEELDFLGAPFKKGSKTSLASRAKEAGLEDYAKELLLGSKTVDPSTLVLDAKGRQTVKEVRVGLQHIIAETIAKDTSVLEFIKQEKDRQYIVLQSTLKKSAPESEKAKFHLYHDFQSSIRNLKDYQILAINRAESVKVVTVKVNIPDALWERLGNFCRRKWPLSGANKPETKEIFEDAIKDAIQRLLSPLLTRQIRRLLTEQGERSALSVFAGNLKNLLLTAPIRGKVILGIDPGIKNGCKMAIVSPHGKVLYLEKIYISNRSDWDRSSGILVNCVKEYNCESIGIGNGKFSRETEEFISNLINSGRFRPLDVRYTIVDEQGVSIYSCSPAAESEFTGLDPTLISAVSLARRIQDPLAELVKVEPRHLGVGMYQHDVPDKKLTANLDEVVSECVSFVGVDINTASVDLLRRVAGLSKSRADAVALWRAENGSFSDRQQLLKVKGIGNKTFQQCAGFIRIIPETALLEGKKLKTKEVNPLDRTEIHPEDYALATRIINDFKLKLVDIGSRDFIRCIKNGLCKTSKEEMAANYDTTFSKLKQVTDALQRETDHDLRNLSDGPLFRRGASSIESLKPGDLLTGVVRNVVQFGAFVDIGVGVSGLIHSSSLGRDSSRWVQLGDRVNVRVNNVDCERKRIGLALVRT